MLVLTKVSFESKGIEFERHVNTALKKKKTFKVPTTFDVSQPSQRIRIKTKY